MPSAFFTKGPLENCCATCFLTRSYCCRMFVKVSVGYGGEGKKSAPLDLLLYDSQCWHCSLTGECNAKPNNKCVFSAATSSVQTFRIGKSISNGDGGIVLLIPAKHNLLILS